MAKKIYISSTFGDLHLYREKLQETIRFLRGHFELVRIMEYMMPGSEYPILENCLQDVRECDIYILIIGKRYGSIEPVSGLSFTENEYREADGKKIIIPLIADENAQGLEEIETDNKLLFEQFKSRVQNKYQTFIKNFTNPDHLSNQLLLALYKFADVKWALKDEVKFYCNREGQFLEFIGCKRKGKLNIFTLVCRSYDKPEYFTHRMAVSEFGLQKEYIKRPIRTSTFIGSNNLYKKHRIKFITHLMINFIGTMGDMPATITECFEYFLANKNNNIFIELYLCKEDTMNPVVISSLKNFLNELQEGCDTYRITFFCVVIFEFPNDTIVEESIVSCLSENMDFDIWDLDKLEEIQVENVKDWVRLYVLPYHDSTVDDVLLNYFHEQKPSYNMGEMFPKLDEIVGMIIKN